MPSDRPDTAPTVVVVPCYNEELRLDRAALASFARSQPFPIAFVLVNDGSRDGTLDCLRSLRDEQPDRFHVLDLPSNQGKAEAVRAGFLHALSLSPSHVGFWDADLATPLDALVAMRGVLVAHDKLHAVIGSRVRLLGRRIERRPVRHYLGRVFATVASMALGVPVYDTQCGAKLFRASPLLSDLFAEPFLTRWIFDVEILARLIRARERHGLPPVEEIVYEFTLSRWRDVKGSKVKPGDFLKAGFEMFEVWRRYRVKPS